MIVAPKERHAGALVTDLFIERTVQDALAYLRDESTLPGAPWCHFRSLTECVSWMIALATNDGVPPLPTHADDAWEAGPGSGSYIFERVAEEELPSLENRLIESTEPPVAADPADRSPGWERRLAMNALETLLATGHCPDEALRALPEPHASVLDAVTRVVSVGG